MWCMVTRRRRLIHISLPFRTNLWRQACGTGQPVMITGDLNAEPPSVPATAKAISCGLVVALEKAYALVKGDLYL